MFISLAPRSPIQYQPFEALEQREGGKTKQSLTTSVLGSSLPIWETLAVVRVTGPVFDRAALWSGACWVHLFSVFPGSVGETGYMLFTRQPGDLSDNAPSTQIKPRGRTCDAFEATPLDGGQECQQAAYE